MYLFFLASESSRYELLKGETAGFQDFSQQNEELQQRVLYLTQRLETHSSGAAVIQQRILELEQNLKRTSNYLFDFFLGGGGV